MTLFYLLGCGISVLLRMLWVLSVVLYHTVKGTQEDDNKYTEIIQVVVQDFGDAEICFAPHTQSSKLTVMDIECYCSFFAI